MKLFSLRPEAKRSWTRLFALSALGVFMGLSAQAQTRPPLRILVGFAAGGGIDTTARILAEAMGEVLGQTVIVENRPGAGGLLAAQALKNAAPNDSVLLLTNDHTVAILPHTLKNPGFSAAKDFTPVAVVIGKGAMALATHPGTQITQLKQIPEWVRKNPGQANFGVPAPASVAEFAVGLLGKALQVDAAPAAYRGGAPLVIDLAAGQIPFGLTSTAEVLPFAKSGKVRILAVSGTARQAELPEVPTFAELGIKGLEQTSMVGLYAPAATPPALVARYSEAARTVLATTKVKARIQVLGSEASYGSPDALAQGIQRISDAWGPVIRASGYQPQ